MARETPLHRGERIADDALAGESWTVEPSEHVGHTFTVLGRVHWDDDGRDQAMSIFIIECSCGDRFRMSQHVIERHVDQGREHAS